MVSTPPMLVEPLVLDGENRLPGDRRDLAQRHLDALFLEERVDRLVLPIEQRRRLGHVADAAEALAAGHRGGKIDREPYQPDCNDPRHGDEAAQADEKGRFPLRKRQNGPIEGPETLSGERQQTAHEGIRCKCPARARGGKADFDYGLRTRVRTAASRRAE